MTEQELRQRVCDQARYWLGRNEADGSHRVIIDVYNSIPIPGGYRMTYDDPWCAAFVSAVGYAVGLSDIIYPDCGCESMIRQYKAAGRWEENDAYKPQPGDVIFYDWQDTGTGDNTGFSDHVGLVLSTTGNTISVIEGNTSDMVAIRTRTVDQIYIRGYGLPDYASKATEETIVTPVPSEDEPNVFLPVLSYGRKDGYVRSMQTLLIAQHFSCGGWGADGSFGPATQTAVRNFQSVRGLPVTGVCDAETWESLTKW